MSEMIDQMFGGNIVNGLAGLRMMDIADKKADAEINVYNKQANGQSVKNFAMVVKTFDESPAIRQMLDDPELIERYTKVFEIAKQF